MAGGIGGTGSSVSTARTTAGSAVPLTIGRQMALRTASAAVGVPVLIGAIWVGSPYFSVLVAVGAGLGAWELTKMAENVDRRPPPLVTVTWAVCLVAVGYILAQGFSGDRIPLPFAGRSLSGYKTPWVFVVAAFAYVTWQVRYARSRVPMSDVRLAMGIALYTGGLLAFGPLMRGLEHGREWVLFTVLVTFAADTSAFFVGRAVGRIPLAPQISPGKTREGAVGGLGGAVAASLMFGALLDIPAPLAAQIVLGLLIGVAAQAGDLAESWMKRKTEVKDSGNLIPGHGGVLDRLDSIVPNLPLVYIFAMWVAQ